MAHLDNELSGLGRVRRLRQTTKFAPPRQIKYTQAAPPGLVPRQMLPPVAVLPVKKRRKKKGGFFSRLKKVSLAPVKLQRKLTEAPLKLAKKKRLRKMITKSAVIGGIGVGAVLLNRGRGTGKSRAELARETGVSVHAITQAERSVEQMDPATRMDLERQIAQSGPGALQSPDAQAAIAPVVAATAENIAETAAKQAGVAPETVDKIGDAARDGGAAGAAIGSGAGAVAAETGEPGAAEAAKAVAEQATEAAEPATAGKKYLPMVAVGAVALFLIMRRRRK